MPNDRNKKHDSRRDKGNNEQTSSKPVAETESLIVRIQTFLANLRPGKSDDKSPKSGSNGKAPSDGPSFGEKAVSWIQENFLKAFVFELILKKFILEWVLHKLFVGTFIAIWYRCPFGGFWYWKDGDATFWSPRWRNPIKSSKKNKLDHKPSTAYRTELVDWLKAMIMVSIVIHVLFVTYNGATYYSNVVFAHAIIATGVYRLINIHLEKDSSKIEGTFVLISLVWMASPVANNGRFFLGFDAIFASPLVILTTLFVLLPIRQAWKDRSGAQIDDTTLEALQFLNNALPGLTVESILKEYKSLDLHLSLIDIANVLYDSGQELSANSLVELLLNLGVIEADKNETETVETPSVNGSKSVIPPLPSVNGSDDEAEEDTISIGDAMFRQVVEGELLKDWVNPRAYKTFVKFTTNEGVTDPDAFLQWILNTGTKFDDEKDALKAYQSKAPALDEVIAAAGD